MNRSTGRARVVLFVIGALFMTVGLVAYTVRHRPAALPADADHRPGQTAAECQACHGPTGSHPRGPNHPVAEGSCFNCHEGV